MSLEIAAQIGTAIAGVAALIVAYASCRALGSWRKQLVSQHVRDLLKAVYCAVEVLRAVRRGRSSFISTSVGFKKELYDTLKSHEEQRRRVELQGSLNPTILEPWFDWGYDFHRLELKNSEQWYYDAKVALFAIRPSFRTNDFQQLEKALNEIQDIWTSVSVALIRLKDGHKLKDDTYKQYTALTSEGSEGSEVITKRIDHALSTVERICQHHSL